MRICILVPSYNHGETLPNVVREARAYHPVIVVDDGSTDGSAERLVDAGCEEVIRHEVNRGKGAALQTGFRAALARGFTHAITIDADGQHSCNDIPALERAAERSPGGLILGVRHLAEAGAPAERQAANRVSNFWFRVQTGLTPGDTQCGFRCYPLARTLALKTTAGRYGYELEVMVRAVWAGYELVPVPVRVDYAAPSSRNSHFRPIVDFVRLSRLHARLTCQAICLPASWRKSLSLARSRTPE